MTHDEFQRGQAAGVDGDVDRLVVVFGDQLDVRGALARSVDAARDAVLMMEVAEEATHVPSHRQRTVLFLAAMRHFAVALRERGVRVRYVTLDDPDNTHRFETEVVRAVEALRPRALRFMRPGEWRVLRTMRSLRRTLDLEVEMIEDDHFYLAPQAFDDWAAGRAHLVMEHFYRMMRRRFGVLVDHEGRPEGGEWNLDKQNRRPFRGDPAEIPPPTRHRPDGITRAVMDLVGGRFPDAPGRLDHFRWPVTRAEAQAALRRFIAERLPKFGDYQDAMAAGEPWMYHAVLSAPLNLKLLSPRACVAKALEAYEAGAAPLNAVEGFVRQLLGWREFIRGVYWREGESYGAGNALDADVALPQYYWSGETDMSCLRQCLDDVLEHGYGHHIQRLMVTGNFALIAGVHPRDVSDWYLGMYVDGVDWVTLPNALGMVMHADGGVVGTKPYAAGGNYINRMSDYCATCRYDPKQRTGDDACPFSTLYWDFLARHRRRLEDNPRMGLALRNLDRLSAAEKAAITRRAKALGPALDLERTSGAAS